MAVYQILFRIEAEKQIGNAYEWGLAFWGEIEAELWLRELYEAIFQRLTHFPLSCPIAPESEEVDAEFRQFILGHRYRILCKIQEKTVVVLQLLGPFSGSSPDRS